MTLATIRKYKNMQNEVNGIIVAREHNIHLAHRIRTLLENLYDAHFYQLGKKKLYCQDLRQARRNARRGIRHHIEMTRLTAEEV